MRHALLISALCSACAVSPAWALEGVDATPAGVLNTANSTTAASNELAGLSWGRLQGRLAFATTATPLRTDLQGSEAAFKVSSLSLMGDYYLRPSLTQLTLGGLRATSGIMFGQRSGLWGAPSGNPGAGGFDVDRRNGFDAAGDHSTSTYLGLGYTGTGGSKGNWGFSADLGVMSLSPGSIVRLGKVINGSQNLDDMVRDLRLSPVLQFGVNYAF